MACASIPFTNPGDLAGTSFRELSGIEAGQFEPQVSREYIFEDIVGKSPALQKALEQVAIVAPTECHGPALRGDRHRQGIDCTSHSQTQLSAQAHASAH